MADIGIGNLTIEVTALQLHDFVEAFRDLERASRVSHAEIAAVAQAMHRQIERDVSTAIMTGELPARAVRRAISFRSDLR